MKEILKIKEVAHQASRQNGCRIYDIYKHRDRLQILIDKSSQTVNLKDCENVFHSMQFLLQSELPHILNKNRLEVSSPGIEKHLRERWHFEESIGDFIKLILKSPIEIQNKQTGVCSLSQSFTAQLIALSKDQIRLKKGLLELSIPFSKIKSAQITSNSSTILKPKKIRLQNNKKARS